MNKRILATALSLAILFGINSPAYAQDTDIVTAALLEQGFPQIVIDTLDEDIKQEFYEHSEIFAGAVIQYYDESSESYITLDINADGSYVMPRGQIPTSSLTLSWTFTKYRTGNVLTGTKLTFNYNWRTLPTARYQDEIGISWDSDYFKMADGGFVKVDKYDTATQTANIKSNESAYAKGSDEHVIWYADLAGYGTNNGEPTRLYGYAQVTLVAQNQASSGSTIFYATYAHALGSYSIGLSYIGSFTVSNPSNTDLLGSQKTFYWDYS